MIQLFMYTPQSYIWNYTFFMVITHALPNRSQKGWYSINLSLGMEGWVDLGGWLHTEIVYPYVWRPHMVTHPSFNRAKHRAICWSRPTCYHL